MFVSQVALVAANKPSSFAFTLNVAANDTVTIGNTVYTFVAAPSAAFEVDIGADLATSIGNLAKAINLSGVAGTDYGTGTTRHPSVTATAQAAALDLVVRFKGVQGNEIALAASSPGANSITPGGASIGAVAGGTNGSGDLVAWANGLLDFGNEKSDTLAELLYNFLNEAQS